MGPFVAHIAQFADQGALGEAEGLAEDLVPLLPHDAQQQGCVEVGELGVFGPVKITRPFRRYLGHPVLAENGLTLTLDVWDQPLA